MIVKLLIVIISGVLVFEDFKSRHVSVWALACLGLVSSFDFYFSSMTWLELGMNISYISVLILVSGMAMKLRRSIEVSKMIGTGDIIFLYLLTPLFPFEKLVVLIVIMFLISLMAHLILVKFKMIQSPFIPLIGYMGSFLICIQLFDI